MVVVALGGIAYRFTIQPIKHQAEATEQKAGTAMSRADTAVSRADDCEETAEDLTDRVDRKLDNIDATLDGIEQVLAEQAREARGRTFTVFRLTEAIRDSDDIDTSDVPDVDKEEFLNGERHHEDND